MVLATKMVRTSCNGLIPPNFNSVIRNRIERSSFGRSLLNSLRSLGLRGIGRDGHLFLEFRHDANDGESVCHPIALQDVVAVRFWREDDVLVADGRGDLHLGAFCGLYREFEILAEGRDQLVAVAVISAVVNDRRVDELELDLDIGCRGLLLDGGLLLLLGGGGGCHLLRRLLSLGLFRGGLELRELRLLDGQRVLLAGLVGIGARVVREHGHVQEREHQEHRQQD